MRVKSLILSAGRSPQLKSIALEGIEMNRLTHSVRVSSRPIHLNYKEFQLLWLLLEYGGAIVRFREIKDYLWGDGYGSMESAICSYITRIKQKLGHHTSKIIHSVPGIGYRIETKNPRKIFRQIQQAPIHLGHN